MLDIYPLLRSHVHASHGRQKHRAEGSRVRYPRKSSIYIIYKACSKSDNHHACNFVTCI